MRNLLFPLIFILLSINQLQAQQPEWVASLSIDPEYYIGISSCEKSEPDFIYYRLSKQLYRDNLVLAYDNALDNCQKKNKNVKEEIKSKLGRVILPYL